MRSHVNTACVRLTSSLPKPYAYSRSADHSGWSFSHGYAKASRLEGSAPGSADSALGAEKAGAAARGVSCDVKQPAPFN